MDLCNGEVFFFAVQTELVNIIYTRFGFKEIKI